MLARKEAVVFGLDADGTIYAQVYQVMLLTLALEYGSSLSKLAELKRPYTVDEKKYLTDTLTAMREYIHNPETPEACMAVPCENYKRESLLRYEFIAILKVVAPEFYAELLCAANPELMKKLIFAASNTHHLFLAICSLRQTNELDEYNAAFHGTGSIFEDIYLLADFFKKKLPGVLVEVFPFTMMDAVNNQVVGTSFQAIMEGAPFDGYQKESTKLSLHYALIHGVCTLLSNRGVNDFTLAYHFIDDLEHLHHLALNTFFNNRHLLPQQVRFNAGLVVNGNLRKKYIGMENAIQGTGAIDALFLISTQKLQRQLAICERFWGQQKRSLLTQQQVNQVISRFNVSMSPLRGLFAAGGRQEESTSSDSTLERTLNFQ